MVFIESRYGWILQGKPGGTPLKNFYLHSVSYINLGPMPEEQVGFVGFSRDRQCSCQDLSRFMLDPFSELSIGSSTTSKGIFGSVTVTRSMFQSHVMLVYISKLLGTKTGVLSCMCLLVYLARSALSVLGLEIKLCYYFYIKFFT